jgi:hypothetical protein
VAGTGWGKASWEVKKDTQFNKQIDDEGMVENPEKDEKTETDYGCNNFEPLNFFNVFVAPNSPSWAKAPYIIVRHYKPFTELENDPKYDTSKHDGKPEIGQFDINNQARNRVVNNTNTQDRDTSVDTATIYECYERKSDGVYLTTYAQSKSGKSWVEVRSSAKRYWHKYYPIVPFYIRKKTFSPWGESLFENNATLQAATNDIFNHYADNLNVSLDSMIMYEDGTLTNDFVVEPGGEITYTGDVPKQFKFPEPNPAQITMVMNQLQGAIEMATVPQYISGVPDSSTDKTAGTAKGISLITEAATEKIGFMKDNFKQSMVVVGKIWLSNLAQFQDQPQIVEYSKDGQMRPDIVLPQDYQGKVELTIDDDSLLPLTKDERRDIALAFNIQLGQIQKMAMEAAQFFQDPTLVPKINWSSRIDEIAKYFSIKDTNRIMEKATASPLGLMGDVGGGLGQTVASAAAQGQEGASNGFQSQVGA